MPNLDPSYLDAPAIPAPAGHVSDFEHPGGIHRLAYFAIILCGALAALSSLFRIASRIMKKPRHIGIGDFLLVAALGLYSGFLYLCYEIARFPGFLVHEWNIRLRDTVDFSWRLHLASNFYGLTLLCLKLAILIDWLHLFNPRMQRNTVFWTIHVLLIMNTIYYISAFFLDRFRCSPIEKTWNPLYVGGSCPIDANALNIVSSLLNLISDFIILLLPQWIIWRLNLTKAKKLGASLLFVIGIFATACGIARMVYSIETLYSKDYTYIYTTVGLWSLGELTSGFLVIGVPSIPKVYRSLYSQPDSIVHTMATRLRGTRTADSGGGAGRAHHVESGSGSANLPSWFTPRPSSQSRDMWNITRDDGYGLLPDQHGRAAYVEAYPDPASSVELPEYAIIRETRVQISSQPRLYSDGSIKWQDPK
ncbi:hypothetical protein J7T55_001652 [Diaporthe amygdali]|uniref:uncharacterized protein n=1 Tax=Phomopsis amygdali TaxID=1214568 RepID=UPI0022FE303F|nr:uncharacterized protein J7T55_001652 [Diaporthe amygdali]KAJ0115242.1 hypothetical protein J7T55_001652 [Diaporthe amygdali]